MSNLHDFIRVFLRDLGVLTCAWNMMQLCTVTACGIATHTIKVLHHPTPVGGIAPWLVDWVTFAGLHMRNKTVHTTMKGG